MPRSRSLRFPAFVCYSSGHIASQLTQVFPSLLYLHFFLVGLGLERVSPCVPFLSWPVALVAVSSTFISSLPLTFPVSSRGYGVHGVPALLSWAYCSLFRVSVVCQVLSLHPILASCPVCCHVASRHVRQCLIFPHEVADCFLLHMGHLFPACQYPVPDCVRLTLVS